MGKPWNICGFRSRFPLNLNRYQAPVSCSISPYGFFAGRRIVELLLRFDPIRLRSEPGPTVLGK